MRIHFIPVRPKFSKFSPHGLNVSLQALTRLLNAFAKSALGRRCRAGFFGVRLVLRAFFVGAFVLTILASASVTATVWQPLSRKSLEFGGNGDGNNPLATEQTELNAPRESSLSPAPQLRLHSSPFSSSSSSWSSALYQHRAARSELGKKLLS